MKIHYFISIGSYPIRTPPQIPLHKGIMINDLIVHNTGWHREAWRCVSISPQISWVKLAEGTREYTEDGKTRVFVITKGGLPGWVVEKTVARKYKSPTITTW
jgi:hypothetical protein